MSNHNSRLDRLEAAAQRRRARTVPHANEPLINFGSTVGLDEGGMPYLIPGPPEACFRFSEISFEDGGPGQPDPHRPAPRAAGRHR